MTNEAWTWTHKLCEAPHISPLFFYSKEQPTASVLEVDLTGGCPFWTQVHLLQGHSHTFAGAVSASVSYFSLRKWTEGEAEAQL